MKRKIALLYGGVGVEHEVSLSGYLYVRELLEKSGCEILPVYISKTGEWTLTIDNMGRSVFPSRELGGSLMHSSGEHTEIDVAIPLLHGDGGESGEIQGLLMAANIPYIGANVITSAVCLDKHYTKCIAEKLGIPVARWVCFSKKTDTDTALLICESQIGFPIFIKPRRLGSSVGAYAIRNRNEFYELFPKAMSMGGNLVIAEELFEKKRELECAFYEARGVRKISAPGEILTHGFYGYDEKYNKQTKTVSKAKINAETAKEIQKYNHLLADTCSLRHLARIDYFLTERGLVFNEINTFPGFTESSLYPKLLCEMGIDPRDAISAFIEDAIHAGTLR